MCAVLHNVCGFRLDHYLCPSLPISSVVGFLPSFLGIHPQDLFSFLSGLRIRWAVVCFIQSLNVG
jgi:hypothetical protein